jgi:hypothetical protein
MRRGPGRIEQEILARANEIDRLTGEKRATFMGLAFDVFHGGIKGGVLPWRNSRASGAPCARFAASRTNMPLPEGRGGSGSFSLRPDDPLSAMWAKLTVENKGGTFICCGDARKALEAP